MNGHHLSNGLSKGKSPLPQANGVANASTKGPTEQSASAKPGEKRTGTNGALTAQPTDKSTLKMDELPEEILTIVRNIPPEAYVPMARLIDRAAQSCWSDLTRLLQELATMEIRDPRDVKDRIAGEVQTPNDTSEANRAKKYKLWNFAENHKRALVKLLVLTRWSADTDENKVTIALNFYLHGLRAAFTEANNKLDEWIYFIHRQQDAAPDLETAVELLAAGRIANLPNLGYVQERTSSDKEMLATLRRLNNILNVRMLSETELPPPFTKWHVHDGRVTFTIPDEFDMSLSLLSEEADAKFQVVDVNFSFRPAPVMSQSLLDEILIVLNHQLLTKGLDGAYQFMHDLTMSQKLKELHRQALELLQGTWANNLRIELHRRTLIVQYWTRRPGSKSWVEITINSGRLTTSGGISEYPIPYLHLRWLKNGKLSLEHGIHMNLSQLSFESILSEITASHTNSIFDDIYDKMIAMKLFTSGELDIEQSTSVTDGSDCSLAIDLTKTQTITLTCDPVSGEIVISPAGERANRLQAELRAAKNVVDDFVGRFAAFRCGVAQATLYKAMTSSSWRSLPGRKPSLAEVRDLFHPSTNRAVFFRQKHWSENWMLAASFGADGDFWWLISEPDDSKRSVQRFRDEPIHIRRALPFRYFEALADDAATEISLQTLQESAERRNIKSILPTARSGIKMNLSPQEGLNSLRSECTIAVTANKKGSPPQFLTVLVKSEAPQETLELLASTVLDGEDKATVLVAQKFIRLQIGCLVGADKMDHIMKRLHYIDDVTSCLRLIERSPGLSLQRLTPEDIVIDYFSDAETHLTLSFALMFHPAESQPRIQLLPEKINPHLLINDQIRSQMSQDSPLYERLKSLLESLRSSLALVKSLQYLQGLVTSQEVPEMTSLSLAETRKWLRIHIIPRTMVAFAVHYSSTNAAFKHRDDVKEFPEKMLVRLEIEPRFSHTGGRIAWLIRPAIEEFRNYTRPSFSSQELKQHLQDTIFSAEDEPWIGLDHAVQVPQTNPYPAIIALHNAILNWLKEAVEKFSREPIVIPQTPTTTNTNTNGAQQVQQQSQPQAQIQTQAPTQMQAQQSQQIPNNRMTTAQQQQFMQARQAQAQAQAQMQAQGGRGRAAPMINMQGQSAVASPRVMTAPPQQMRQVPPGAGRGRGQPQVMQQGGRGQGNNRPPQPRDVINLD